MGCGWSMRNLSIAQVGGALLLCVVAALTAVGVAAPFSFSGWLYLLAVAAIGSAAFVPGGRTRRAMLACGLALIVGTALVRGFSARSGRMTVRTLPAGAPSRWLARIIDEQDVALCGARLLIWAWDLKGEERDGLSAAMQSVYREMRAEFGTTPSPVMDTLLGRQTPEAFDTIILEPPRPAKAAVIFLHGFAGSFDLECWLVAEAARDIDAVTLCPATTFSGHWTGADGEAIFRATLEAAHARGIRRLFLAGLSNGGVGAAALASRFASELSGVIVISGAPGGGSTGGLPTLVIQGKDDQNMPAEDARLFASSTHATYAEFDGGHFVQLMRRHEVRPVMSAWLRAQR